jgi:heat-inducible transcriptional repressor
MTLGERKLQILAAVVEAYIRTGEPVGSKMIRELMGNTVSSATIRNDMADLAERGLLDQPHTSAGRVPTDRGYRMYLTSRMEKTPLSREDRISIDAMLTEAGDDPEHLLERAVQSLAYLTNCVAVVTTPSAADTTVKSIQIVPVGRRTAVVVLMASSGIVKTRVFRCSFDLTTDVMRVIARLASERILHQPIEAITVAYMQSIAASIGEFVFLVAPILLAILEAAQETARTEVFAAGQGNLMQRPEYSDTGARRVMDFVERHDEVAALLGKTRSGVNILIGPESGCNELMTSSIVTAGYSVNGADSGRLALIGPTRMDYPVVISYLEYFAERLEAVLAETLRND